MPVKDLTGAPRPTAAERALRADIQRQIDRHRRDRDDGLEPVAVPSGPKPSPLTGAAEEADGE